MGAEMMDILETNQWTYSPDFTRATVSVFPVGARNDDISVYGTHFDPAVVEAFFVVAEEIKKMEATG